MNWHISAKLQDDLKRELVRRALDLTYELTGERPLVTMLATARSWLMMREQADDDPVCSSSAVGTWTCEALMLTTVPG